MEATLERQQLQTLMTLWAFGRSSSPKNAIKLRIHSCAKRNDAIYYKQTLTGKR